MSAPSATPTGVQNGAPSPRVRDAFRTARVRYKRIEGVVEFYATAVAAAFNSRRQEVDDDDAPPPSSLAPSGFPALENLLFPKLERARVDSARRIVDGMQPLLERVRRMVPELVPTDAQLVEIARLELARVATLGIAGFDAPRTGAAMRESADALDGIRDLLRAGAPGGSHSVAGERAAVDATLSRAAAHLRANDDFENFDRLAFIAVYEEPAARAIDSLRRAAHTTPVNFARAWRYDVPSVYEPGAFDPRVYAQSSAPQSSPALVALGARLFAEPTLSGPRTRSCASCHVPSLGFLDGLRRAASIDPRGTPVARNTPTLINAGIQPAQFADERAVTLEDQVMEVLRSPAEMASSINLASSRLAKNAAYDTAFARAFGDTSKAVEAAAVTPLRLRQALAAYVRSLVALNSRFDRAVRGDTTALAAEERRGFNLFMGKAGCGTCHFAPLFSGDTPPRYINSDVEVVGTPASPNTPSALDADSGRAKIDHMPIHLRAFKTPSLRNAAITAPYMHNGAFRTLDEVILFYDRGGALGGGGRIANQTLAADSLHLTAEERHAIVAFLGTLTDTVIR